MKSSSRAILAAVLLACAAGGLRSELPRMLPGERSADDILNGVYPYPAESGLAVGEDRRGFDPTRLTPVPAPGVHPRILLSPDDLPALRQRVQRTETGRALLANLRQRTQAALRDPSRWTSQFYARLVAGDVAGADALVQQHGWPSDLGHYKPWVYALALESLDALLADDRARSEAVATALATYVTLIRPEVDAVLDAPLGDDVWRGRASGPATGPVNSRIEVRSAMGYQLIGYTYDFAFPFMTAAQRDTVRALIARFTSGRVWLGAELPHHFRNWNWVAIGLQQPLLALAIEGEPGYDARVYRLGVEIARDYLTYGISAQGMSTEAVGYTQFGLVWANPFFVAASRRGDNLLVQAHHRAMLDWYVQSLAPAGNHWTSHGDGGDTGPALWTLALWRYHFPGDARADYLWQRLTALNKDALAGDIHLIETLLWCSDSPKDATGRPVNYAEGAALHLPLTLFDPTRSSLIARSAWKSHATAVQFECRTDSVGASHEHADRGAFTLDALGRSWAKDNFRSVETKYHNSVLIDGRGQGYWPGPGRWLGLTETDRGLVAVCDAKDAYDWFWPKQILTEDPATFVRFKFPRWAGYAAEAQRFQADHAGVKFERDTRPSVVRHWQGFTAGDPRMWDEDSWPVRAAWNPVRRAFRTLAFVRGAHPYVVVVDDIQKDDREHLYEWLMQTGLDTALFERTGNDLVLGDATVARDENGVPKPARGARELLVRILDAKAPADPAAYTDVPTARLETFERKDTLVPEMAAGALSGSRSYGLDARLVIASRAVAPDFKLLLYPLRAGEKRPTTTWNADRSELTIEHDGARDTLTFRRTPEGRTELTVR